MKYIFPFSIFILMCVGVLSGQNYALFFAVNEYEHFGDLENPIQNAVDIAGELESKYGFEVEVVKNPSRMVVRQKLLDYSRDFERGDKTGEGQLLLFFSGHGEYREAFNNGYWVPADGNSNDLAATTLLYSEWRPFIDNINCKHILVVIDACFSGTFDPKIAMRGGDRFGRPNEPGDAERLLQEHQQRKARLYLASGAKEKTPDKSDFAKRLLTGLRKGPDRYGLLSIDEIFVDQIKMARPIPVFGAFGADEAGSSFLFTESQLEVNTSKVKTSQADLNAWKKAERLHTIEGYKAYINQFPNGRFGYLARAGLVKVEEAAWEQAQKQHTIQVYEAFLANYPMGKFSNSAKRRILEIEEDTEWEIAQTLGTVVAYQAYLDAYPKGRYVKEAQSRLEVPNKERKVYTAQPEKLLRDKDGNTYAFKTMKDGKRWMTQNLNIKIQDSYCYKDKDENCRKYGRLYTFEAAKEGCRLLGDGWRLPTDKEWANMVDQHGGAKYGNTKDVGKAAYNALIQNGSSGFAALLGGWRSSDWQLRQPRYVRPTTGRVRRDGSFRRLVLRLRRW